MQTLDHSFIKHSMSTAVIPLEDMMGVTQLPSVPAIGDVVLAEVISIGKHTTLELRDNLVSHIFPNDVVTGAFGNRYATSQFEGYVPRGRIEECNQLSVGGLFGEVASSHATMLPPTRLRLLGAVCDDEGRPLNTKSFGLQPCGDVRGRGQLILVVGSSMDSGKTTATGTVARALRAAGASVAAAKITGTASSKDRRFFASCGARPVLDFTKAGYPSTYMLDEDELLHIFRTLVSHLRRSNPDYIVLEIADGIFQRETRLLLDTDELRHAVDHVLFTAGDSLAIECGVRRLRELGWPVRATAGLLTQSPLAMREAEEVSGLPCLSIDRMLSGELLPLLQRAVSAPAATTQCEVEAAIARCQAGHDHAQQRLVLDSTVATL